MVEYKCLDCSKMIDAKILRRRVRCPYCGSKILYKFRSVAVTVKAR
ncbi:MAG: DNA-directed RNA polymerase subunit P [Candidatus Woesearchaeota archaeon]